MSDQWTIPTGLSPLGEKVARTVDRFFVDERITDHGGGGRFYSPQEWEDRGESYGKGSLLVITHDGGDHAAAFSAEYGNFALQEKLRNVLDPLDVFVEQATGWYSCIYPA